MKLAPMMVAAGLTFHQGSLDGNAFLQQDASFLSHGGKSEIRVLTGGNYRSESATPVGQKKPYEFGSTTFYKELYLGNGAFFSDVLYVEIEMISVGEIQMDVVDANGRVISASTPRANEHGGWHTFHFSSGMNPPVHGGAYRIRLWNNSSGAKQIKQGRVVFH